MNFDSLSESKIQQKNTKCYEVRRINLDSLNKTKIQQKETKHLQVRCKNIDSDIKNKVEHKDKKQHQKSDGIMLSVEKIFLKMGEVKVSFIHLFEIYKLSV